MTRLALLTVVVAGLAIGCGGGGGGGGSTSTSPSNSSGVVTVAVLGTLGNGSFVPNPVPTNGSQVMFKNNDTVNTHHIVMDDGSADFGNIAPGTSSTAKAVSSGNFHC